MKRCGHVAFLDRAVGLERRSISEIERAELVAEWVRITAERKPAQDGQVSDRGIVEGRGNKGGVSEAARRLGMSRDQVSRSLKVATIRFNRKNLVSFSLDGCLASSPP